MNTALFTALLAASFPVNDWQFWVVTVAVLIVVALAARPIIRGFSKKPRGRRVDLTVDRDRPRR